MRTRSRKQDNHNLAPATGTPVQAKSLTHVRPIENSFDSSQMVKGEDAQTKPLQEKQAFNFSEMPIFADGAKGVTPRVQSKFFKGGSVAQPVQRQEIEEEPVQGKLEPVQREEAEEEEPVQGKLEPVQREEAEEEEPVQGKLEPVQREEAEEEEPVQGKLEPVQREEAEEEEPVQGKLEPVQREEAEEEEPAQAKGESEQVKATQPKINLAPSGSGKVMPEPVQEKMETAFGADFSGVRIHEGPQAKAINAVAYTQGENIHFQPGKYQPETQSGQELLGHELTHVVQQKAGRVTVPQGKGAPINADSGLESEADILGAKAAQGESVKVAGASSISQRQESFIDRPNSVVQQSRFSIIQRKLTPEQIKHANRIRKARGLALLPVKVSKQLNSVEQAIESAPVTKESVAEEPVANQPSEEVIEPASTANQERENPPLSETKTLNQLAVEQPREYVYKYAENNWFKVKKQFKEGYLHHEESPKPNSKETPHGMSELLEDRQNIVNELLEDVKKPAAEYEEKKRGEIWEQQFGKIDEMPDENQRQKAKEAREEFQKSARPLIAKAPGSTKPSSDIDVNMSGDGSEYAVSWLNEQFREKYGHGNESGQVYDVNFYGKDFVPGEVLFGNTGLIAKQELDRQSVRNGEKEEDKFYSEDKWRNSSITNKDLQKEEMEDQTIASLTMMRVNMEHDEAMWNQYVQKASADPEMKAILTKVEERYQFRKRTIQEAGEKVKEKAGFNEKGYKLESLDNIKDEEYEELKTMSAENLAYENMLSQVETARVKYELLKASNAKTEDIEKAAVELKKIKTQATMFANASYYTEGAVVGIVANKQVLGRIYKDKKEDSPQGKQALKKLELKPQEYYQSFNEQVGFAFHALSKIDGVNFYRDIPEPGKYVHRAYSMLRHFYRALKKQALLPFTEEQRRATSDWEGVKQGKKRIEGQEEKGYVGKLTDAEKDPAIDRIFLAFGADNNLEPQAKIDLVKTRLMELKQLADKEYISYMQQMFSSPKQSEEE